MGMAEINARSAVLTACRVVKNSAKAIIRPEGFTKSFRSLLLPRRGESLKR
jgi:hypothetical protein